MWGLKQRMLGHQVLFSPETVLCMKCHNSRISVLAMMLCDFDHEASQRACALALMVKQWTCNWLWITYTYVSIWLTTMKTVFWDYTVWRNMATCIMPVFALPDVRWFRRKTKSLFRCCEVWEEALPSLRMHMVFCRLLEIWRLTTDS